MRTIQWIENNWSNFKNTRVSMDQIAVAVALEYTKFRFTDKWSGKCVKLKNWLYEFNENQFMKDTIPREA